MKKFILILLTFGPVAIGYFINLTVFLPGIGRAIFYVVPFLTLAFWFYLGSLYSKTAWRAVPALLIGNAVGILSLLLYIWQFVLETDETRSMTLAALSQMFAASAPSYILARPAMLFGQAALLALHIISVVFMAAVFACGYFWGRRRRETKSSSATAK